MMFHSKSGWAVLAAMSVCVVTDASALSFGRVKGAVLLGQPLEVTVPVEFGPDDDINNSCVKAVVYYGDALQPTDQTRLMTEATSTKGLSARIFSSASVSEPVVTVELIAGCTQTTRRKFTLFADLAGDPDDALSVLRRSQRNATDPAASGVQKSAWEQVAGVSPDTKTGNSSTKPVGTPSSKVATIRSDTANRSRVAESDLSSRLKLVAPEVGDGRKQRSKASVDSAAVEELQKRIDAISQWKESLPSAEEVQKNEGRMQSLAADLKALQAVTQINQNNLQAMAVSQEQSESHRPSNSLVYLLAALTAAATAAAAWTWAKSRGQRDDVAPWWGTTANRIQTDLPRDPISSGPAPAVQPIATQSQQVRAMHLPTPNAASPSMLDVDISIGESAFAALPAVKAPDIRDFLQSGPASLRAVNMREMLDERQQAEFFMALGQYDEAIKVLETSMQSNTGANPLVYLDLLKILHTLSRREEFDRYRDDFNTQFTGMVPTYAQFASEGSGLEVYPDICRQLVELWPEANAVEFIEMCLVRQPEDEPGQGFDLDAFRDLLMLHGVLRRLDSKADSSLVPFSASRLMSAPLVEAPNQAQDYDEQADIVTAPLPPIPHAEDSQGGKDSLDLDLSGETGPLMEFDAFVLGTKPDDIATKH
jgi:tetratricopeptide (TPR) repeat protein